MSQKYDRDERPDNYVPSRWTVTSNVELEASDVDLQTGQTVQVPARRRRQAEEMRKRDLKIQEEKNIRIRQREQKKKGVRIRLKWGVLLLLLTVMLCGVVLAAQYGYSVTLRQNISEVRKKAADVRGENNILQAELDEKTSESTICSYASKNLGMRPAKSVEPTKITIPGEADPAPQWVSP